MTDRPVCEHCGAISEQIEQLLNEERAMFTRKLANLDRHIARLTNERLDKLRSCEHYEVAMRVLEHWRAKCKPRARELGSQANLEKVYARINGGFTEEELKRAVDGYAAYPYLEGAKRSRTGKKRWDAVDIVFRDAKHVEDGMELAEGTVPHPTPSSDEPSLKEWEAALEAHGCAKEHGDWTCPVHEDRSPSLSVKVGKTGKVVAYCHAGCRFEEVRAALGLEAKREGAPKIRETYDYVDENGERLFQVVRLDGKAFRQRRPNGNGGWDWNLNGTRRVPYRLPRLLQAARQGDRVWVVEGEKDVHALEKLGEVATCNPGGAGKWRDEYNEFFAGVAAVAVIADRDDPGRTHAREVAQAIGSVAKVKLGEPAEGKDVSDHLAAGRGLGDFLPMEEQ